MPCPGGVSWGQSAACLQRATRFRSLRPLLLPRKQRPRLPKASASSWAFRRRWTRYHIRETGKNEGIAEKDQNGHCRPLKLLRPRHQFSCVFSIALCSVVLACLLPQVARVVAPLAGGIVLQSCGPLYLGLTCALLSLVAGLPLMSLKPALTGQAALNNSALKGKQE